jgi:hypothetical protein
MMDTFILLGHGRNLFVFDYGRFGTGTAPFNGDVDDVRANWETASINISLGGTTGVLYRHPDRNRKVRVVES